VHRSAGRLKSGGCLILAIQHRVRPDLAHDYRPLTGAPRPPAGLLLGLTESAHWFLTCRIGQRLQYEPGYDRPGRQSKSATRQKRTFTSKAAMHKYATVDRVGVLLGRLVCVPSNLAGRRVQWMTAVCQLKSGDLRRFYAAEMWAFEVSRDRVSARLLDVPDLRLLCVAGAGIRGCRRSGPGGAGWPGCGTRRPGGPRAWRGG
jgi:hypothetical protein